MKRTALILALLCAAEASALGLRPIQIDAPPPRLGVRFEPGEVARAGGILLTGVLPGYPADAAGLRTGDILFRIDGQAMTSDEDLTKLLARSPSGAALVCDVLRARRSFRTTVMLVAPKSATVSASQAMAPSSRPAPIAKGEPAALAALAEARRLLEKASIGEDDLDQARHWIDQAVKELESARRRPNAVRPRDLAERANALAKEGKTPAEVEAILESEFSGVKITISGPPIPAPPSPPKHPSPPPHPAPLPPPEAESRPDSRPSK